MKVQFKRWALEAKDRRPLSIEPSRVDVIEHYQDRIELPVNSDKNRRLMQFVIWWGEDGHDHIPAATRIIMHNKQEYLVQGTVPEITDALNGLK